LNHYYFGDETKITAPNQSPPL